MSPALRKVVLTAHVISSVGWLGAVVAFLALAVAGLMSADAQRVRGAYIAMELIGSFAIVPLSLASLVIGVIQSLSGAWGLFRHYWVLFKLMIAIVATGLLLLHMQPTSYLAKVAANTTLSTADFRDIRIQLTADAAAAVLVLIVATILSIYKPRGLTPYGWRKEREQRSLARSR
jgi:hypothetical protein